ncbi:hypothetical protein K490DRAFT_74303 [Saccharata proteae CBS 121410]|uniref:Histone transcription regulator 3 homolog n=1 Tax=Saccharata proteae CBS 121410 TaxID=1314787 RepID=A0A9P4LW49_9PEZI|nr:hypothetical protein K490DRAFT_74303 [Saccharata proteae CBS 121410]
MEVSLCLEARSAQPQKHKPCSSHRAVAHPSPNPTRSTLNLESDNESDDEIDDTKEVQIEEALKLYQTALKYHSEGPRSFAEAKEAYAALFESEIFKYPESLSEYRRTEIHGDVDYDTLFLDDYDAGPVQLGGNTDNAPNTLPQILHLSYKNHGQFVLEVLRHRLKELQAAGHDLAALVPAHITATTSGPLRYFAEALDKDDSDLDLWSRTSSVATLVGSRRIARYCLEAVLDGDDEGLDSLMRIPGLEEGFASQQLKELVEALQDDLSLMQAPLSEIQRKKLSTALKKRLAPYAVDNFPAAIQHNVTSRDVLPAAPLRVTLKAAKAEWAIVGECILQQFFQEQQGLVDPGPGASVYLALPSDLSTAIVVPQNKAREIHVEEIPKVQEPIEAEPITGTPDRDGDAEMKDVGGEKSDGGDDLVAVEKLDTPGATTRKRSTDSAGLTEMAEDRRGRSKRIRARESVGDASGTGTTTVDVVQQHIAWQRGVFEDADDFMFDAINKMLEKLKVTGLGVPKALREMIQGDQDMEREGNQKTLGTAVGDLYAFLQTCPSQTSVALLNGQSIDQMADTSREAGLNAFLGYAKSSSSQKSNKPLLSGEGLITWAGTHAFEWTSTQELTWSFLQCLLRPGHFPASTRGSDAKQSSYMRHQWSDDLKRVVVQLIVHNDDFIYNRLVHETSALDNRLLEAQSDGRYYAFSAKELSMIEMIQTLFELHLDIYSLIRHPGSSVDVSTRILQRDRLERWVELTRDVIKFRSSMRKDTVLDELEFRHIWASTFHLHASEDVDPGYVLHCVEELKTIAGLLPEPVLQVQNNAIMPELSVGAAERELTKMSMKECFVKVFQHDEKDPVTVIESLEPILESDNSAEVITTQGDSKESGLDESGETSAESHSDEVSQLLNGTRPSPLQAMTEFISSADVTLRLSLWQRLRQAYEMINYTPKVVSCYLRSLELLVDEIQSLSKTTATDIRTFTLLRWIRIIDEILVRVLKLIPEDGVFDFMDEKHLQSSLNALGKMLWLLNTVTVYEDGVRVKQLPLPGNDGAMNPIPPAVGIKLHDTQVRGWLLQYLLLKEGQDQNPDLYPTPMDDRFEYLRHLHYAMGTRGISAASNKIMLRVMKDELLKMFKADDVIDKKIRDKTICQVLYDLYGINCFTNLAERQSYNEDTDILDSKTALKLIDFVMYQTKKINFKDLHKTNLGQTVDMVHGHLARTKPSGVEDLALNRAKYLSYIKAPINPLDLYRCVHGVGSLSTKPVPASSARIASKGWHFLMGSIVLNRFEAQNAKRQSPIPTEDLNIATAFFGQDIEYDSERWETWYNLAKAYDYQVDELVAWSAEKVNKQDPELVQYQRFAIRCYTMAVATAVRNADHTSEVQFKLAKLYADFGKRMYASSRAPLSMQAFLFKESEEKFLSRAEVEKSPPFSPLSPYKAWKFASGLLKRSISRSPDYWHTQYALSKCLWKLHTAEESRHEGSGSPTVEEIVATLIRSIETLPSRPEKSKEPILEPHYKLLSILHKLVQRKEILPQEASAKLQASHYARGVPQFASDPDSQDHEDWDEYVLKVLKNIRAADKSNWHHRMTARAANIHYGQPSADDVYMSALTAKNEFQHIFTKTMQIQVWRPENERLGRHFVYTTRYSQFFILLLVQTNDRAGLEALARKVRRKNHEFYEHTKLWQFLCIEYLKMLRRAGRVPQGHEDTVFKSINHEEFTIMAGRLEAWCHDPQTESPNLDILGEVIELRRLNNGLMKPLLIDDLICDAYAMIYQQIGPTLPPLPSEATATASTPAPAPTPAQSAALEQRNNMMSMQNIMNIDGSTEKGPAFSILQTKSLVEPPSTKPARQKGVGRRELMKRAEAAVTKPVIAPVSAIPIRPSPKLSSVAPPSVLISNTDAARLMDTSTNVGFGGEGSGHATVENSIQDSEDDESELRLMVGRERDEEGMSEQGGEGDEDGDEEMKEE